MVNKKYTFFLVMLLATGLASKAQSKLWDWNDKAVVSEKDESHFNDFASNKNPYPAKPRNAWELGFAGGPSFVRGDVSPKIGYGGSVTLRKALNNTFSYRIGYFGSLNYGKGATYSYGPNQTNTGTTAINEMGTFKTNDYSNQTHSLGFDLIASLNTFSNYRGDPKANLYVLGGFDIVSSKTRFFDPKGSGGGVYHWIRNFDRKDLLVKNKEGVTAWFLAYSYGIGFAYKINSRINIGFEERLTTPVFDFDYIDAYKGLRNSKDTYFFSAFKLNYNLMK